MSNVEHLLSFERKRTEDQHFLDRNYQYGRFHIKRSNTPLHLEYSGNIESDTDESSTGYSNGNTDFGSGSRSSAAERDPNRDSDKDSRDSESEGGDVYGGQQSNPLLAQMKVLRACTDELVGQKQEAESELRSRSPLGVGSGSIDELDREFHQRLYDTYEDNQELVTSLHSKLDLADKVHETMDRLINNGRKITKNSKDLENELTEMGQFDTEGKEGDDTNKPRAKSALKNKSKLRTGSMSQVFQMRVDTSEIFNGINQFPFRDVYELFGLSLHAGSECAKLVHDTTTLKGNPKKRNIQKSKQDIANKKIDKIYEDVKTPLTMESNLFKTVSTQLESGDLGCLNLVTPVLYFHKNYPNILHESDLRDHDLVRKIAELVVTRHQLLEELLLHLEEEQVLRIGT